MKKNILILAIGIGVLTLAGCGKKEIPEPIQQPTTGNEVEEPTSEPTITSFEECLLAGFPVMESYPRQCNDGNTTFTENVGQGIPVVETGITSSGVIQPEPSQPQIQTGTSSGSSSLSQYIEKLRGKKESQPGEVTSAAPSSPMTTGATTGGTTASPETSVQQPTTSGSEGVTEQDIEKLEKIIDQIAK